MHRQTTLCGSLTLRCEQTDKAFATPVRNSKTWMRYCSCCRSGYDIPRTKWLLFLFLATEFYRRRALSQILLYACAISHTIGYISRSLPKCGAQTADRVVDIFEKWKVMSHSMYSGNRVQCVRARSQHTSGIWSLRRYTLASECIYKTRFRSILDLFDYSGVYL